MFDPIAVRAFDDHHIIDARAFQRMHQQVKRLTDFPLIFDHNIHFIPQPHEPVYATLFGRNSGNNHTGRGFSASREELTDAEGKKLISLHVGDTKYDSDSDFDYRQRPPR